MISKEKIMQKTQSKAILARIVMTIMLCAVLLLPSPSSAQMTIARIDITNIDSTNFPEVKVRAILRDGNGNPVSSSDIGTLELAESVLGREEIVSNIDHAYSTQPVTPGIETMFVVDTYKTSLSGASGKSLLDETRNVLQAYIGTMKSGDTAGIWELTSEGIVRQAFTSDPKALNDAIGKLGTSDSATDVVDGMKDALAELSKSPARGVVVQTIVLISQGDRLIQIPDASEEVEGLISTSVANGVPIHTLFLRDIEFSNIAALFQSISNGTGGKYTYYVGESSISSILTWLDAQRAQMEFSFRSKLADNSERTVELRTTGTSLGFVNDTSTYLVNIIPPLAILASPANNTEITRQAEAYDTDMSQVTPTEQLVTGSITFPNFTGRKIVSAQFLLDGEPTGTPLNYPGSSFTFSWDLTGYREAGTFTHQIQVKVRDELGMESTSEAVNVKVTVVIPPPDVVLISAPTNVVCKSLEGFDLFKCQVVTQARTMLTTPQGLISIGSLLVALVAVFLAVRYRGQIAGAGHAAVDVIRETIASFTRPANMEAGAFLEVIRGDEELKGKYIPIYTGTVTPVGRSPQEAELVFDQHNDRSVVSRIHCEFRGEDGEFFIRDVGSTQGTFVNGIRVPEGGKGQVLSEGDKIELGPTERGGILLVFHTSESRTNSEDDESDYKTNPAY
jgi:hypothetical protein